MKHIMKKTVYTAGISAAVAAAALGLGGCGGRGTDAGHAEGTECRSGRECNYGDRARGGKGCAGYGAD